MDHHIAAYRELLAAPCQPPAGLSGDGVIYAMFEDNDRADAGISVGLWLLRELGWTGRVQLWHVGHHPELPAGLDVEIIDAREVQRREGGEIRSWTIKSFAIRHSGLARAMWLDWDAYPCRSPSPLFAALVGHPIVYWASGVDDWRWRYNAEIHEAVYGGQHQVGSIQGGCYLLDCRRAWRELTLVRYCDDHYDWWYPANRNSDEEAWRLAIAAAGCDALWAQPMTWNWPAWINHFERQPYVVHRCSGKLWKDCVPKWNRGLPMECRVQKIFRAVNAAAYRAAVMRPCDRQPPRAARAARIRARRRVVLGQRISS